MRHWCFSPNISGIGESPHKLRFDKTFEGVRVPFGTLIDFKRSPVKDAPQKFAPKTVPGVFLGYHLLPGGKWSGDYIAAELADFKNGLLPKNVSIQRIKEIRLGKPLNFL